MVTLEFKDTKGEVYYIKAEAHSLEDAKEENFSFVQACVEVEEDIVYLVYRDEAWTISSSEGMYHTWNDFELADPKLAETVDNLMDEFFLKALK